MTQLAVSTPHGFQQLHRVAKAQIYYSQHGEVEQPARTSHRFIAFVCLYLCDSVNLGPILINECEFVLCYP